MTDQPKEFYDKKPGFVVKSGVPDVVGKPIDYSVITDEGQGFQYTKEGNKLDACKKTSYEICGENTNENEPAKIIKAKNGNIIIEALSGDIILKARNIRIVAMDGSGEVTINSSKQVSIQAPIQNFKGTNLNTVMSNEISFGALSIDTTGLMQNTNNTGTEEAQSGILSRLLGVVRKFQKFFE
jgi:hypothetical protein